MEHRSKDKIQRKEKNGKKNKKKSGGKEKKKNEKIGKEKHKKKDVGGSREKNVDEVHGSKRNSKQFVVKTTSGEQHHCMKVELPLGTITHDIDNETCRIHCMMAEYLHAEICVLVLRQLTGIDIKRVLFCLIALCAELRDRQKIWKSSTVVVFVKIDEVCYVILDAGVDMNVHVNKQEVWKQTRQLISESHVFYDGYRVVMLDDDKAIITPALVSEGVDIEHILDEKVSYLMRV